MDIKRIASIMILVLTILFTGVHCLMAEELSNSDERSREISNNVSEEYVTCAAYFGIASEAVRRSGENEVSANFEKARDAALEYALISASQGRTKEMAQKVTLSRLELNMKSMTSEIDNNVENISILINKHAQRCKEIMDYPEKMMDEWADKVLKRHKLK